MTNLLLDTHVFIWYSESDPKLSNLLKIEIETADRVYLSIASLWEIAIKLSIGKLSLRSNYESIEASLEPAGINLLPISFADTVQVKSECIGCIRVCYNCITSIESSIKFTV